MRVTTVPLETKFLAQLDKHTSKLLEVIRSKGGRVKELTKATLQVLDEVSIYELVLNAIHSWIVGVYVLLLIPIFPQTVDITIRRECIFKSLMIYLGEPVHHLIKDCQVRASPSLTQTISIYQLCFNNDVQHWHALSSGNVLSNCPHFLFFCVCRKMKQPW